jgi:hypothetical protein
MDPAKPSLESETETRKLLSLTLVLVLMVASTVLLSHVKSESDSVAKLFTDPSFIQATEVGQDFTVNINVSGVVDLYGWQTGLTFNPEVLECLGFHNGELLRRANSTVIWVQHVLDMNNSQGIIYMRGSCRLGNVSGVTGDGQIAYATFRSVGIGISDFHPTDVVLINSNIEDIDFEVEESVAVKVGQRTYEFLVESNMTGTREPESVPASGIFNVNYVSEDYKLSFDAKSMQDWFLQIRVPRTLLTTDVSYKWTIQLDGVLQHNNVSESSGYTTLRLTNPKGDHQIEITGTAITIAPSPPSYLVMIATLVGLGSFLVAIVNYRKTRYWTKRRQISHVAY